MKRTIIHLDMDAFYASVEQRDRPELRGKPVIVGGSAEGRGVVSAASYEARAFGVHSAMPTAQAKRLCPTGVFLPVDMRRYQQASRQVMAILRDVTPLVEPLSCDEAFLDVTGTERLFGPPVEIARAVKQRIREELSLTASVGIAPNKFLAKLASDLEKPNGFVVVREGEEKRFLAGLPISRLWGVGPATERRLARLNIKTIDQLAECSPEVLRQHLGDHAAELRKLARGEDDRSVEPDREAKSLSAETTFAVDTSDRAFLRRTLLGLAEHVGERLRDAGFRARTVTLKARRADFTTYTRDQTLSRATDSGMALFEAAWTLLQRSGVAERPLRLIGVGSSNFATERQLDLFQEDEPTEVIDKTLDDLRRRFGKRSVIRAGLLDSPPPPEDDPDDLPPDADP